MARQRACEYYLVDGYNVINAWPELMRLRGNLDEARDVLVHILTEYGAFENYEMTVVFDAFFTEDEEHTQEITPRMRVVYTGAGETADSCIERLAYTAVRAGRGARRHLGRCGAERHPRCRGIPHYLTRTAPRGKEGKETYAYRVHWHTYAAARPHRGA